MITRQEIENFIPGQWTLTDAQMQEIKELALRSWDTLDAMLRLGLIVMDEVANEQEEQR